MRGCAKLVILLFLPICGCNLFSWIQPYSEDPSLELESGKAYMEQGDFQRAIYHMNRALALSKDLKDREEAIYLRCVAILKMERVNILYIILPEKVEEVYRTLESGEGAEKEMAVVAGSIRSSEVARMLPILRREEVSAIDTVTGIEVEDGEARFVGRKSLGPEVNLTAGVIHSILAAAYVADIDGDGSISDAEGAVFGEVADLMKRTISPSKVREFYGKKVSDMLGFPYGSDGYRRALDGIRAKVLSEISIARVNLEVARDSLSSVEGALKDRIDKALSILSVARGAFSW
jgi:tetratricopeptide (TPR) repeat protein